MSSITWTGLWCPHCKQHYMVLKDKKYEPHECTKCGKEVIPEEIQQSNTPYISNGHGSMNKNLSREFANGVLAPIMGQKGANQNRKYG